ncbi:h-cup [Drosophila busckii]|uniref:H-cup n=1 Tax=Drosophila busckii TaxID=30019 RepID=A0A0M4EN36_DROBS|nr:h-cup [Drosophila busckii]
MLTKSSHLIDVSQTIDQQIIDSCGTRDDQLLKNLVKYCDDEERLQMLLENVELKDTVNEYKAGVEQIRKKYKEHCETDILHQSRCLRDKYINGLHGIVKSLELRMDEMADAMMLSLSLEEQSSGENQRIIKQLSEANAKLRQQLQIGIGDGKSVFHQGLPPQSESGTQIEAGDVLSEESDSCSLTSIDSFMTCLSSGCESQLALNMSVSELDVSNFIEQALGEEQSTDNEFST